MDRVGMMCLIRYKMLALAPVGAMPGLGSQQAYTTMNIPDLLCVECESPAWLAAYRRWATLVSRGEWEEHRLFQVLDKLNQEVRDSLTNPPSHQSYIALLVLHMFCGQLLPFRVLAPQSGSDLLRSIFNNCGIVLPADDALMFRVAAAWISRPASSYISKASENYRPRFREDFEKRRADKYFGPIRIADMVFCALMGKEENDASTVALYRAVLSQLRDNEFPGLPGGLKICWDKARERLDALLNVQCMDVALDNAYLQLARVIMGVLFWHGSEGKDRTRIQIIFGAVETQDGLEVALRRFSWEIAYKRLGQMGKIWHDSSPEGNTHVFGDAMDSLTIEIPTGVQDPRMDNLAYYLTEVPNGFMWTKEKDMTLLFTEDELPQMPEGLGPYNEFLALLHRLYISERMQEDDLEKIKAAMRELFGILRPGTKKKAKKSKKNQGKKAKKKAKKKAQSKTASQGAVSSAPVTKLPSVLERVLTQSVHAWEDPNHLFSRTDLSLLIEAAIFYADPGSCGLKTRRALDPLQHSSQVISDFLASQTSKAIHVLSPGEMIGAVLRKLKETPVHRPKADLSVRTRGEIGDAWEQAAKAVADAGGLGAASAGRL